ncbi:hypothetical protein Fmac_011726 [Flemingia macrophylla]|uniref:Hydroxyproline-rich glycoprotein family protein n=1 Tax=Flemingia macrophylla TaxID=520843 RepID=A0ABD1MQC5_9FABA
MAMAEGVGSASEMGSVISGAGFVASRHYLNRRFSGKRRNRSYYRFKKKRDNCNNCRRGCRDELRYLRLRLRDIHKGFSWCLDHTEVIFDWCVNLASDHLENEKHSKRGRERSDHNRSPLQSTVTLLGEAHIRKTLLFLTWVLVLVVVVVGTCDKRDMTDGYRKSATPSRPPPSSSPSHPSSPSPPPPSPTNPSLRPPPPIPSPTQERASPPPPSAHQAPPPPPSPTQAAPPFPLPRHQAPRLPLPHPPARAALSPPSARPRRASPYLTHLRGAAPPPPSPHLDGPPPPLQPPHPLEPFHAAPPPPPPRRASPRTLNPPTRVAPQSQPPLPHCATTPLHSDSASPPRFFRQPPTPLPCPPSKVLLPPPKVALTPPPSVDSRSYITRVRLGFGFGFAGEDIHRGGFPSQGHRRWRAPPVGDEQLPWVLSTLPNTLVMGIPLLKGIETRGGEDEEAGGVSATVRGEVVSEHRPPPDSIGGGGVGVAGAGGADVDEGALETIDATDLDNVPENGHACDEVHAFHAGEAAGHGVEYLTGEGKKKLEHRQNAILQDYAQKVYAIIENDTERTKREVNNSRNHAKQNFAKSLPLRIIWKELPESFSKVDTPTDSAEAVLKKVGVEKFDPMNEPFDSYRHNTVFQIPDASKPSGTVAVVLTE